MPHSLGAGAPEGKCPTVLPSVLLSPASACLDQTRPGASRPQRTQEGQPPAHRSGGQTQQNVLELAPPPVASGQRISRRFHAVNPAEVRVDGEGSSAEDKGGHFE